MSNGRSSQHTSDRAESAWRRTWRRPGLFVLVAALLLPAVGIDKASAAESATPVDGVDSPGPPDVERKNDNLAEVPSPVEARLVFQCIAPQYADVWVEIDNASPKNEFVMATYETQPGGGQDGWHSSAPPGASQRSLGEFAVGSVISMKATDGVDRAIGEGTVTVSCGAYKGDGPIVLSSVFEFVCVSEHRGKVLTSVTNESVVVAQATVITRAGFNGGDGLLLAPGETGVVESGAVDNGDSISVEVWSKDGPGALIDHGEFTVYCGRPEPSADAEVGCTGPGSPYVYTNLRNDGLGPADLTVTFDERGPGGGRIAATPLTVRPHEPNRLEFHARDGATYTVSVHEGPVTTNPIFRQTLTVDCSTDGETGTTGPTPKFTG